MKLRVVLTDHESPRSEIIEFRSAYCLIGRKNATLLVADKRCSSQHVLLYEGPDRKLWVRDLGSTNGTFVNGKKIELEQALKVGDAIRIGRTSIVIAEFTPVREGSYTRIEELLKAA